MDAPALAQRVRMYFSESDSWHQRPAPLVVLELLRREGCAGASLFKGIAGFGAQGRIHTAGLVDVSGKLPIVVEWVDTPERVRRLLPRLAEMTESLITVEDVMVAKPSARALRDVPARILVQEAMTPAERVDAAAPATDLRDLVALLLRKRRNAIPVVDAERRVVGIVANRDLVERAGLPLRLELLRGLGEPEDPAVARHLAGLHGEGHIAASIMTAPVVTVPPDVPVTEAARLMLERRLKRLPVVDEEGRLLGMLSRFDVLRTVADGYPQPERAVPRPDAAVGRVPRRIGDVMNRHVPTVRPDTPLLEVLDAVMATRLHRAVVVDAEGTPIGIVVDTDLMQRVTPAAHPGLFAALMRRVRAQSPEERAEWQRRTGQRAADVMRPAGRMLIVPEGEPIAGVIDRSLARGMKLVAVTDREGKLAGMADRADLLAALAPGP